MDKSKVPHSFMAHHVFNRWWALKRSWRNVLMLLEMLGKSWVFCQRKCGNPIGHTINRGIDCPMPSNRQHSEINGCLEDNREDYYLR